MTEKITVDLKDVQATLFLPLWGRAVETKKSNPLLIDQTAVNVMSKIDYDFNMLSKNIHPISRFEWICRSLHIDRTITEFLSRHPRAAIVNVGCGLDTTFERIDNGKLLWYDLDLPDVIELRRKFIPESSRRKFLLASFLDDGWLNEISVEDNVLLIAAGVLYYFDESQIKNIFNKISFAFPGSEFVFDAASRFGVKTANKKVIESSGLDERSYLKWGIDSADEMPACNDRIEILREYPMFRKMTKSLDWKNKITAFISDHYKIMYMVHIRFKRD